MLNKEMTSEVIAEATGLTMQQLEQLKAKGKK